MHRSGQFANRANQLFLFVGNQPGNEVMLRRCASTIDHQARLAMLNEQARRLVTRRVHCSDTEQNQLQYLGSLVRHMLTTPNRMANGGLRSQAAADFEISSTTSAVVSGSLARVAMSAWAMIPMIRSLSSTTGIRRTWCFSIASTAFCRSSSA